MSCSNYLQPDPGSFGYTTVTGDGTTGPFTIGYDFPYKANAVVGQDSPYLKVYVGGDLVSWTFASTNTISLDTAATVGTLVEIKRQSAMGNCLVVHTNDSDLTAARLQLENNQHQWLIQELWMHIKWLGCRLDAVASATGAGNFYTATGDGSTLIFSLSPETDATEDRVLVFYNGVLQNPNIYTITVIGGVSKVTFDQAPVDGSKLTFWVFQGTLVGYTIADGTVTSGKLATGAVTWIKTDFDGAGADNTFLCQRSGTATWDSILTSDVSGLSAYILAKRLDQFAIPTADISMNSHKITNVVDPTSNQHAATKKYVDDTIAAALPGGTAVHCQDGTISVTSSLQHYTGFGYQFNSAFFRPDINYYNSLEPAGGSTNVGRMYPITIHQVSADGDGEIDHLMNPSADQGTQPIRHLYITRTATGFDYRGSASFTAAFTLWTNG